ncbi:uncharacterized protein LOC124264644 [Haliotis rubra]|uniref:uncharacterized protein LOC124264644 n=1 Tax=Haliotis rubra TaxID=36100 RepID=UPI001EE60B50|nr:uncharacterized protein LOC124264644 [Haliotis rubra]
MITKSPGPILQYFDPKKPVTLETDASQNGLGAVIFQDKGPVAFASKAVTNSQRNYAQIEKETLAILFGCEKFHYYLFWRNFKVITDHKPLEVVFKKPLHAIPLRLQRMRMRLQIYDADVEFTPGKNVPVAGMLSRHFIESSSNKDDLSLDEDIQSHVHMVTSNLPVSDKKMEEIRKETNGLAEKSVQTVKRLLLKAKQSGDYPYWSLLAYRNTPLSEMGSSPAQLLLSRSLRTDLPSHPDLLKPKVISCESVHEAMVDSKMRQKHYYDRSSHPRPALSTHNSVRLRQGKDWIPGVVTGYANTPRSYHVKTDDGAEYSRNKRDLHSTNGIISSVPGDHLAAKSNDSPTESTHVDSTPQSGVRSMVPVDLRQPIACSSRGWAIFKPSRFE